MKKLFSILLLFLIIGASILDRPGMYGYLDPLRDSTAIEMEVSNSILDFNSYKRTVSAGEIIFWFMMLGLLIMCLKWLMAWSKPNYDHAFKNIAPRSFYNQYPLSNPTDYQRLP